MSNAVAFVKHKKGFLICGSRKKEIFLQREFPCLLVETK